MKTIAEILAIPNIGERIELLKRQRGIYLQPNRWQNWADWNEQEHEIVTNKKKYPDQNVIVEKGKTVISSTTGKPTKTDDKTEKVEANRIALPIEQDLVNIHTSFAVGEEPRLSCDTSDDNNRVMLSVIRQTLKKNFMRYKNKQIVRAWLSEQEVAEYWYIVPDADGFWRKIARSLRNVLKGQKPTTAATRLKCAVWSPFRGDDLYPFMENDNMTAFLRGYKVRSESESEQQCYMCITATTVYTWKQIGGEWKETRFEHHFGKLPLIYMWRPQSLTRKIRPLRVRLEKLLSEYADCIDYHFFPYIILKGEIEKFQGRNRNHLIQLMGDGASAQYLTWNQVPETVKFEVETITDFIYSFTNTPRLSFKDLAGTSPVSGESFKYRFMGANLAAENEYEEIGIYLQRRINFLITALGTINVGLSEAQKNADIEIIPQPYTIESLQQRVSTAAQAVKDGIWSRREGIMFAGNTDYVEEEIEAINEEMETQNATADKNKKVE